MHAPHAVPRTANHAAAGEAPGIVVARAEETVRTRSLMLCADDYALSRGIGFAVRRLAAAGRISAVSCIAAAPLWPREAGLLRPLVDSIDVGLHLTLTNPPPLGPGPKSEAAAHPTSRFVRQALLGQIDRREIDAEIDRQIDRFEAFVGRLPDFIDGHHHVHILPGVRDAVLDAFARRLGGTGAWLRFPPRLSGDVFAHWRFAVPGAAAMGVLGITLRRLARARGIPGNTGMRGIRRFFGDPPYARLFERFLPSLGDGGLIICHPGLALTETIPTRHPIAAREEEFEYLMSDAFRVLVQACGYRIARFGNVPAERALAEVAPGE